MPGYYNLFKLLKMKLSFLLFLTLVSYVVLGQNEWKNMDSLYAPLPASFHVYKSERQIGGKPNIMYYAIADLKDPNLKFTSDTAMGRRLTPAQYYQKEPRALLIVNASFFSFATNENLNYVVKDGMVVSWEPVPVRGGGSDSSQFYYPYSGTFGITRSGNPDIAWVYTPSGSQRLYASERPIQYVRSETNTVKKSYLLKHNGNRLSRWKVEMAVGGGPVLVQNGEVQVTNNQERKFAGKAIDDRHPRSAIGYTKDKKVIVFVCEGRSDSAAGLTLPQMAEVMKELGCIEALNLDGGGSTCLLINGKEVNVPSSKGVERPVPSVFEILKK